MRGMLIVVPEISADSWVYLPTVILQITGGWWRWSLVSPDGVATSWMVGVSASVNLPLHHKVQKFSSRTGSPGWSRKRAVKWLRWWWLLIYVFVYVV